MSAEKAAKMTAFPFSAIVGQDRLRLALLLNVIDLNIGGVLLCGTRGTAKSTAVRALAALLPPLTGIASCPYFCDPDDPHTLCPQCAALTPAARAARTTQRQQRLITLPLNASVDRVVGRLDIEAALHGAPHSPTPTPAESAQGSQLPPACFTPGLLAAANRGLLYVDEINLLTDEIADLLLDVLASGVNRIERDGISLCHPARCALIGSMNPEEGTLRPQLLDRFGLFVAVEPLRRVEDRVMIAERRQAYDADPLAFQAEWATAETALAGRLKLARALLPQVTMSAALRRAIAVLTTQVLDAQGHRADIATARTARAIAAWSYAGSIPQRNIPPTTSPQVTLHDIEQALEFTMPHRARARLDWRHLLNQIAAEQLATGSPTLTPTELTTIEDYDPEPDEHTMLGAAGITRRIHGDMLAHDLGATILIRRDRLARIESGRRFRSLTRQHSGRTVPARPIHPVTHPAIEATLRAAAVWQRARGWQPGQPVQLKRDDLPPASTGAAGTSLAGAPGRWQRFQSWRVASWQPPNVPCMRSCKTPTSARDRVALLVFRFAQARLVLPPTRNIALARKQVETLHVGGCTPLALGLLEARRLIQIERLRDPAVAPVLVVLTDGEGNIDLSGNMRRDTPMRDALAVAADIAAMTIPALFIDTGPYFSPRAHAAGWGRLLAEQLHADYYILAPPGASTALARPSARKN